MAEPTTATIEPSGQRRRFGAATTPPHLITLVVLAGSAVMAMNIFLPVLPALAQDLDASVASANLVVTVFLGSTAILQLFVGPLSDRFGRRPVLLSTTAIFAAATLFCVFAPTIEWLLAGRVVQAVTAASMTLSRAIIRDLYDRSKAASMIGYVTMAMAVLPMISPSIGGFIGEAFGWRGTFVALFFIALGVLALIWLDLGETHVPRPNNGSSQIEESLSLLREPAVWGFVLTSTFASGAYFAFLGGAPFIAAQVLDLTPQAIGLYFAFVAIGYMFGNFLSGRYSERIGIEPMMLYGGLVAAMGVAASLVLMSSFEPQAWFLFLPMALVGTGNGMTLPNANAGVVSVRPELAGSASGLAGFMQIGGGALLATLAGLLITEANEGMPLYVIMFVSSLLGTATAFAMWRRARGTA